MSQDSFRHLNLSGATSIGVGAIVGGGIMALAGVACASAGPGALLAFVLNGIIALVVAFSFAEMAAAYPESGGTYTFAKKALSVQSAFAVGWVVWFASIVAATLYAVGFASFFVLMLREVSSSSLLTRPEFQTVLAILATGWYTIRLSRPGGGSGQLINVTKIVVFIALIVGGVISLRSWSVVDFSDRLLPFLPNGFSGVIQAMGYTFIAIQGFDLIAAVSGEVKNPGRVVPLSMVASLGIALVIYIPFLFVIMTAGVENGATVTGTALLQQEALVPVAARRFLGEAGYWLVLIAGVLSMLSALAANLFAASRIAYAMAADRTLPHALDQVSRGIPVAAVIATGSLVGLLILILPDVAVAGAAASLIFLITFTLAQGIAILIRLRAPAEEKSSAFRTPFFPFVPVVGGVLCGLLSIFQAVVVPAAGVVTVAWFLVGAVLFATQFRRRALAVDAAAEASQPDLLRLRGKSPLVLVPIANPKNAEAMAFVAQALAPVGVGKVLLLSVVVKGEETALLNEGIQGAEKVVSESLAAAVASGIYPSALTTIAQEPWVEIERVASLHRCESILLGLTSLDEEKTLERIEQLLRKVGAQVVILRPPLGGWHSSPLKQVLVPVRGEGGHDALRARLLSGLWRIAQPEITFITVVPPGIDERSRTRRSRQLQRYANEEVPGANPRAMIVEGSDPVATITSLSEQYSLVVLGLHRGQDGALSRQGPLNIARTTSCGLLLINS